MIHECIGVIVLMLLVHMDAFAYGSLRNALAQTSKAFIIQRWYSSNGEQFTIQSRKITKNDTPWTQYSMVAETLQNEHSYSAPHYVNHELLRQTFL